MLTAIILSAAVVAAPNGGKRHFTLPADAAEKSLKDFAAQSAREVLFATEMANGVRTNSVEGDFTPAEAMDRLLAGTGLVAAQDDKAGSFTINRASARQESPGVEAKKKTP